MTSEYFEIDSTQVGGRFAISVSLPGTYRMSEETYPLVYAPDGNFVGRMTDPAGFVLTTDEAARPARPFVQVNIGFTADEAPSLLIRRNRDLVPPREGYLTW